jgi:hypothetical protein
MDARNRLLSEHRVPSEWRQRAREYFFHAKQLRTVEAQRELLQRMSPLLRGEMALRMKEKALRSIPYLKEVEPQFLVSLALGFEAVVYAPTEVAPSGYLYILYSGIALCGGKVCRSGDTWGSDEVMSNAKQVRAIAITYVQLCATHRRFEPPLFRRSDAHASGHPLPAPTAARCVSRSRTNSFATASHT